MFASGGVVYWNGWDGVLYGAVAATGKILLQKNMGTGLDTQPTMGASTDGKMMLLQSYGGRAIAPRGSVPGAILAFGLPDKLPQPQVITKEVIKEVPKEVIKEVPKEVIREVVKEVPKEVTKTVTVETVSPITYVGIGLGIIGIVVGAVISRRRQKPA